MRSIGCIVCGSRTKTTLEDQSFDDIYLELINEKYIDELRRIVICDGCGFVYHDPQLDQDDVNNLYMRFRDSAIRAETPDEYFNRITLLPPPESENFAKVSWIISRVPHLNASGGTLLDVGCGGGVFIHTFMNRLPGWQACGVEPTTAYALLARRRLNIPIVNDNYRSGLFGERRFDLISINQVLEHVLDPIKFMKYIRNDISANGYVYLEVPDVSDFENLSSCHDRFMSQHLWFFSKNSLTNICEMAGFVVDHIDVEQTYRGKRNVIALLRLNQTISNAVVRRDDPKEVLAMRDLFHSRQNKETS